MGALTFANPPLVEVSFSIIFERLKSFRTAHFGVYWASLQEEFPETTDKVPLGPNAEFDDWFPPPRVWLIHRDKNLILQIQPDRLVMTWRKIGPNSEYPRFEGLKPMFMAHFERFERFVEDQGLGTLNLQGCELNYVNHVAVEAPWKGFTEISRVFSGLNWDSQKMECREPQFLRWNASWAWGSTTIRADVYCGSDSEEGQPERAAFEIRASSREPISDSKAAELWFRVANEAIVRGFTSLTTEWAQNELWQRQSS